MGYRNPAYGIYDLVWLLSDEPEEDRILVRDWQIKTCLWEVDYYIADNTFLS